jgi:hypothetical protein
MSNTMVGDVVDLTGPPPPLNIAAMVYQRSDHATLDVLDLAFRDRLFPPGSTHDLALHVSWVWPNAFRTRVPDLEEFRVYLKIEDYEVFSDPTNRDLWRIPANWAPLPPFPVSAVSGGALPPRLTAAGVADAEYFETIIFDPPMAPDDDAPVVYGWVGVGGADHAPFNNAGPVSPPVVIFARDLVPPDPPPIPTQDEEPKAKDGGANAVLILSWPADSRYLYHLMRIKGSLLSALPDPIGPPPVCLAPEAPTCVGDDPACVEERKQFTLRVKAAAHPELFQIATLEPRPSLLVSGVHRFITPDTVDATVGDDYLYGGRAIDPAGNVGAVGCPRLVRVRDFLPPRAPVVRSVLGIESGIRLSWVANNEQDLARYRVLRTATPANDGSLDRMRIVLETDEDGNVLGPPGVTSPSVQGAGTAYVSFTWTDAPIPAVTDYYYRIVAVDRSGNISGLSASALGRAIDTMPPQPPVWADPAVERGSDATGHFVQLRFSAPSGDPDVLFRVQRRDTGAVFWRPVTPWLPSGTAEYLDRDVQPFGGYSYRIQAMDPAGNVGSFNMPRSPR